MKKNNQRGFVLAEAFIVSTVVLGILVFMFIQINTIVNNYDRSFTYNTVSGIYITREINKFINDNDRNSIIAEVDQNGFILLSNYISEDPSVNNLWQEILQNANIKEVILAEYDLTKLKTNSADLISAKMGRYINTLEENSSYEYRVIIEFKNDTFASLKV